MYRTKRGGTKCSPKRTSATLTPESFVQTCVMIRESFHNLSVTHQNGCLHKLPPTPSSHHAQNDVNLYNNVYAKMYLARQSLCWKTLCNACDPGNVSRSS